MPNNKIIDLERLSRFKDKLDNVLETKANVDGNYPTMTVGSADNLTPYGENSGVEESTPFVFQSAGGSSDIGSQAYLRELRGNSVAFNQGLTVNIPSWVEKAGLTLTIQTSDNTFTLNGTTTSSISNSSWGLGTGIKGHTYLYKLKLISGSVDYSNRTTQNTRHGYVLQPRIGGYGYLVDMPTNAGQEISQFRTQTESAGQLMSASFDTGVVFTNAVFQWQIFDLTLMFGAGNEPTTVAEFNALFPKPYYEYNAGTLLSCKSNGYKTVGYNSLSLDRTAGTLNGSSYTKDNAQDFEDNKYYPGLAVNDYVNQTAVTNVSISGNTISFKSNSFAYGLALPIRVIAGQTYTLEKTGTNAGTCYVAWYDQNGLFISSAVADNNVSMTAPNNAYWGVIVLRANADNATATYSNICFHLTWDGSRTGFEEHQEWQYNLPNIETRSAGSVYDVLYSTGGGKKRIGVYTFTGNENWLDYDGGGYSLTTFISGMKSYESSELANVKWALGITIKAGSRSPSLPEYTICVNPTGRLFVMTTKNATQLNSALAGKTIYFELTTETDITEEENPGWTNPQYIDDFGTQEFLYDSDIDIPIPQGNDFFYPVDYKAFVDSLGGRDDIEYAADQVVSQTQLTQALSTFLSSIQGYDATKTQTLKNVNGVFQWVDD